MRERRYLVSGVACLARREGGMSCTEGTEVGIMEAMCEWYSWAVRSAEWVAFARTVGNQR